MYTNINIFIKDKELYFIEYVEEVISDTCGFISQGFDYNDPRYD
jgi:hypothetical protein